MIDATASFKTRCNQAKGAQAAKHLEQMIGSPGCVFEYRFHPTRRWRFDLAYPDERIAIEIEGGAFTGGAHTRGPGYANDMEKYNEAQRLGWRVFRFSHSDINTNRAARYIRAIIRGNYGS